MWLSFQMEYVEYAPGLEESIDLREWRRRGREKGLESIRKEHDSWLGELRRLKIQHPKWSRTKIAEEIGRTASPPRHRTTVLKTLKRLEENEGSDF
jgi:hypothetical protein